MLFCTVSHTVILHCCWVQFRTVLCQRWQQN